MKIIVVSKRHGSTRSFTLGGWTRALLSACMVGIPVGAVTLAVSQHLSSNSSDILTAESTEAWEETLVEQQSQVERAKQDSERKLAALTLRVAELQARLVRLDALGERLTTMAKLDTGEFDFGRSPARGGPEQDIDETTYAAPDFQEALEQLGAQIEDRQQQLDTLEALLAKRKLQNDVFLAGRPIKKGWMSSRYGRRSDPFTGRIAWHAGVDFAGKEGSDIIAVASGVVTWSGERYGYGQMVEVNHGNGFSTRYAHCKENLVKVGDVIKKGQVVALMGSSGRSTGPHVHFEVYKNGRTVDPATYIHRASR
ncbi:M23 family metallopeptidase [Teredinibacter turnerae]|uniref:M23 peptidase domain protein n=1 Tax=Teredinibacter turnerae (strain ATCC 39867 / T7901) TaxID=377629 RepID=C5BP27_TERTT|nr:M23 family metallopeptidase [Teredinibacter turnerae]ACR12621.1 M23 peptidase domain protein [Teredinibacter turnerae T7901]